MPYPNSDIQTYLKAMGFGVMAGVRALAAPAMASDYLKEHHPDGQDGSFLGLLDAPTANTVFKLLAAGEMVADKLPIAPARISLLPLLGRGLSGGVVGAMIFMADDRHPATGALVGGLAAVVAAYGSYYLRQQLEERLHLPSPMLGALEDALVVGSGRGLLRLAA